jgi:hypothetical protein
MLVVAGLHGRWNGHQPGWKQSSRIVVGAWLDFGQVVYMLQGAG